MTTTPAGDGPGTESGARPMPMLAWRIATTVLAALAPVAVVVADGLAAGHLPDPLPLHWNASGEVDNTVSIGGLYLVTLLISLGLAAMTAACIWLTHSAIAGRMAAAMFSYGAWITAAVAVVTFVAGYGEPTAADVAMPWYFAGGVVVVPGLLGLAAWVMLPGRWPDSGRPVAPTSALEFAPREVVTWIEHQHSTVIYGLSAVTGLVGAVMLFVRPSVAIPLLIVAVVTAFVCELAVRIDAEGITTLWGPFGWPRQKIGWTDIASVHAEQIHPMAWGGWGYRVSSRGVAAIIRGGPGLVIDRIDKPTYVVTVPRAERGAEVASGLLARDHSNHA